MRKILLSLIIMSLPLASSARERGVYVDMSFGTSVADGSDTFNHTTGVESEIAYDTGYNFSAALGYMPDRQRGVLYHTRFEVEASIRSNSLNKVAGQFVYNGQMQAASLMANAYYDFRNSSQLTPYLGAGFGVTNLRLSESVELGFTDSESDFVPAYQVMAGVTFEPYRDSSSALHLGYRYFGSMNEADLELSNAQTLSTDYRSHIIEGGLRVDF